MILIIDLCDRQHPLSRDEFVLPITRLASQSDDHPIVKHITALTRKDMNASAGIILCSTPLKDTSFLLQVNRIRWLQEVTIPILGISSGMQVMMAIFGGRIEPGIEIGMTPIHVVQEDPLLDGKQEFSAYELHNHSTIPPEAFQVLAVSNLFPQVIRHRSLPFYGVLFDPAVRNTWMIDRFLALCRKGMD